jgi:SAM-dependent methyltransferase
MEDNCLLTKNWYDNDYKIYGMKGQRQFPSEELVRFLSRNYPNVEDRKNIKILELGCGNGTNTLAMCQMGFSVYCIDISQEATRLCSNNIYNSLYEASIYTLSFNDLETMFKNNQFDCIVDVMTTYCSNEIIFDKLVSSIFNILKKNGLFFSFTWSKNSDAFKNYKPATLIDNSTLDGIKRVTSPYYGNNYPFRFIYPDEYKNLLEKHNFNVIYLETTSRTYHNMTENFECVSIVGMK